MINIPKEHIDQYIDLFGDDAIKQIDILQEECAELIQALSKYKRGFGHFTHTDPIDNVVEELTHVAISSEIVAKLLRIKPEDIKREVDKKAAKFNLNASYDEKATKIIESVGRICEQYNVRTTIKHRSSSILSIVICNKEHNDREICYKIPLASVNLDDLPSIIEDFGIDITTYVLEGKLNKQ